MPDNELDAAYSTWKTSRSPEDMHRVVKALTPTINYGLASVNALNDPVVHSKAKLHAAEAVERYNPDQAGAASLPTFVSSHLRQLTRDARASKSIVKMPERIQLDAMKLDQARKFFADQNGRDPDTLELADAAGMPVKRIEKVNKFSFALPTEEQAGDLAAGEGPDFEREAMDYVYHDADHTDRRILELKTGYGGNKQMSPREIGVMLNLTPWQLSRRSMRLSDKINRLRNSLTKIQ